VGLDGIKDGTTVGDSMGMDADGASVGGSMGMDADGASVGGSMGMDADGASVGDSVTMATSPSPSWTLKDVDLAMKSLGKEHLGGRSGLHFLVIMSHSPEQQGVALFEYIELISIKN